MSQKILSVVKENIVIFLLHISWNEKPRILKLYFESNTKYMVNFNRGGGGRGGQLEPLFLFSDRDLFNRHRE